MRQILWLKYLCFLLIFAELTPMTLVNANSLRPTLIAQATAEYDRNMRQGYKATARRDYGNALNYFRQAERLRPGDRYAAIAIRNVSLYVSRSQPQKKIFIASGTGAPINRVAGATRGLSSCFTEDACLIALLPEKGPELLLTVADYPVLLFHIPKTHAQTLEFRLRNPVNGKVYQASLNPPATTGIISINLANLKDSEGKGLPPLEIGKQYEWDCSVILDPLDRSKNLTVDGLITRENLTPILQETLKQSTPSERLSLYATNNLWYDLIATLYQQRLTNPNNVELDDEWAAVLKEINLAKVAQVPLL